VPTRTLPDHFGVDFDCPELQRHARSLLEQDIGESGNDGIVVAHPRSCRCAECACIRLESEIARKRRRAAARAALATFER
jgi:hypothetical protein